MVGQELFLSRIETAEDQHINLFRIFAAKMVRERGIDFGMGLAPDVQYLQGSDLLLVSPIVQANSDHECLVFGRALRVGKQADIRSVVREIAPFEICSITAAGDFVDIVVRTDASGIFGAVDRREFSLSRTWD